MKLDNGHTLHREDEDIAKNSLSWKRVGEADLNRHGIKQFFKRKGLNTWSSSENQDEWRLD